MEERIRVAGIVKIDDGYAFMHRKNVIKRKDFQEYYTFPGGGLEENETLEEGVIREIKEEFGISVKVIKKLYEMYSEKFNQREYFFLCEYEGGIFGTGTGPEFSGDPKYKEGRRVFTRNNKKRRYRKIIIITTRNKRKICKRFKTRKNIKIGFRENF